MGRSHHVGFNFSSGLTSFVSQGCVPRPSGNGDIHYDKGLQCDFWPRQRTPGSYRLRFHSVVCVNSREAVTSTDGKIKPAGNISPQGNWLISFVYDFVSLTSIIRMRWVLPAYKLLRLNVLKTQLSRMVSLWWLIAPCGCLN